MAAQESESWQRRPRAGEILKADGCDGIERGRLPAVLEEAGIGPDLLLPPRLVGQCALAAREDLGHAGLAAN